MRGLCRHLIDEFIEEERLRGRDRVELGELMKYLNSRASVKFSDVLEYLRENYEVRL